MYFNFGSNMNYTFEIYVGNALSQKISMPEMFAPHKLLEIAQDVYGDDRPIKVECYYEGDKERCLIYKNHKYLKIEEEMNENS